MDDLNHIVANPTFNPEQFLHNAAVLFSGRRIVEFLFMSCPELMLIEHNGKPIILDLINSEVGSVVSAVAIFNPDNLIREALTGISEQLANKMFDVLASAPAAQSHAVPRMSIDYIEELIETESELANWTEFGFRLANGRLVTLKHTVLEKLLVLVAKERTDIFGHSNKKVSVIISIAEILPIDNSQIIALLKSEIELNNVSNSHNSGLVDGCINRLSDDKRLELLIHSYQDDHAISETNIGYARRSIKITASGIKCPLCTKRLKSSSGITMHLESMHNIKNRWRRP